MTRNFSVNSRSSLEHDREEKFNYDLFKRCGELGLLGVTTDKDMVVVEWMQQQLVLYTRN